MSFLSPPPKFAATYVDASGYTKPAVGYKLYTYAAGTSTPKDSYSNAALTANANPVVLDARGECDLVLSGNYKLVLKTDLEATIWTVDNINDLTTSGTFTNSTLAGTLTISSTAVTWSGNPTHSGNHTFSGNTVLNGNLTVGDAGADTMTVNASTVTWPNTPTHSGAHTWSGAQTDSLVARTMTFGATFGNTARAGATVLDWYEEGTWSPVLTFGGASTGITYTQQSARYVRIGRLVHITTAIILSSKGSATGNALISGLPFACFTPEQTLWSHCQAMTGLAAPMVVYTSASTTTLVPSTTALATGTKTIATDTAFTNTSSIFVNGIYEVA